MSSKQHKQPAIHLGNYEEFFLLYIDGELEPAQAAAVDAFLLEHPDLRAELDLLTGTKLTPENFSFPKEELMAEHMQQTVIDEELFLYVDNELSAEQRAAVEGELANRPAYQLQLASLMATRLDTNEKIAHPHKKELYRREERAAFPWMRAAAAVVILGAAGIFYMNRPATTVAGDAGSTARVQPPRQVKTTTVQKEETTQPDLTAHTGVSIQEQPVSQKGKVNKISNNSNELASTSRKATDPARNARPDNSGDARTNTGTALNNDIRNQQARVTSSIDSKLVQGPARAIEPSPVVAATLNNSPVTSALHNRTTTEDAPQDNNGATASNEHKGSVRGFLRKATRLIERRTGIDPTSDGELLIGVVAVQLK